MTESLVRGKSSSRRPEQFWSDERREPIQKECNMDEHWALGPHVNNNNNNL